VPGRLIGGDALPDDGVADRGVRQILASGGHHPARHSSLRRRNRCAWGCGSSFSKISLSGASQGRERVAICVDRRPNKASERSALRRSHSHHLGKHPLSIALLHNRTRKRDITATELSGGVSVRRSLDKAPTNAQAEWIGGALHEARRRLRDLCAPARDRQGARHGRFDTVLHRH
jgi:hypothetical protein